METEIRSESYVDDLCTRYPALVPIRSSISQAYELLHDSVVHQGMIYTCGNGGSCADADHIVGELMKSFTRKRPISENIAKNLEMYGSIFGEKLIDGLEGTIPALNLSQQTALTTAFANDNSFSLGFAQQLYGYGHKGDSLIALSTSGNSENVVLACVLAQAKGIHVIALTGNKVSEIEKFADVTIKVPESETFKIQELHLPIYHCLCLMLENSLWPIGSVK